MRLPRSVVEPFDVYYRYNDHGYLEAMGNYPADAPAEPGVTPTDYWLVSETDAAGRPTRVGYGNDVETTFGYDALRGTLRTVHSGVQALTYEYNPDGTMKFREDRDQQRREAFTYDDLGRLTGSRLLEVAEDGTTADLGSTSYLYDAVGNEVSIRPGAAHVRWLERAGLLAADRRNNGRRYGAVRAR